MNIVDKIKMLDDTIDDYCCFIEDEGDSELNVVVTRKSDNQKGSLEFQHSPRFYFDFVKGDYRE